MTPNASASVRAGADLGGGFSVVADGSCIAIRAPFSSADFIGLMSTAAVDARSDAGLQAWLAGCGIGSDVKLYSVNQVHGSAIIHAEKRESAEDADGMWTAAASAALLVKVADCAPVWIVAQGERSAFALIHAGWRGVAAGIIEAAVSALMGGTAEVRPPEAREPLRSTGRLRAAVGPHLGPCCFEVGPEVASLYAHITGAVRSASALTVERRRTDSVSLDLARAIIARFEGCGVESDSVSVATACTRCNPTLLHSYRRNGAGGPLMTAVGLRLR